MANIRDLYNNAVDSTNRFKSIVSNINASGNTNNSGSNKSAYQANVAQPVQTQQRNFSTRFIVGQIATLSMHDSALANEYYQKLQYSMADPQSEYYNPYNQPTNRAVSNLAALGFDTNNLNDDWWNANQGWISSNLMYNGTTNTPSKPGKKSTWDQNVAYELYQWRKSEDTTKKAEQEWQALQEELAYWAKDTSRNYSDDQILEKIDWSKYRTLASMDENKYMSPTELNRSIGYSEDAMYGVLWAARNPEYQGDLWGAMANSALGTGNQWVENPEITAKLNVNDKSTYSPYSVGMTLEQEGLYFGVSEFTPEVIAKLEANPHWDDETWATNFRSVLAAEETTQKAQEELDALNKKIDSWTANYSEEKTMSLLANYMDDNCPTLLKMDKGIENRQPVSTTRAIDYRYADIVSDISRRIMDRDLKGSSLEQSSNTAEEIIPPVQTEPAAEEKEEEQKIGADSKANNAPRTNLIASAGVPDVNIGYNGMQGDPRFTKPSAQDIEINKAQDAALKNVLPNVENDLTENESAHMTQAGTANWSNLYGIWDKVKNAIAEYGTVRQEYADKQIGTVNSAYANTVFETSQIVSDYEKNASAYSEMDALVNDLSRKYGNLEYFGKTLPDETSVDANINGMSVTVNLEKDIETGKYVCAGMVNNETGAYYAPGNIDYSILGDKAEIDDRIGSIVNSINSYADKVNKANASGYVLTEEDEAHLQELRNAKADRDNAADFMAKNQGAYDEAIRSREKAMNDIYRTYGILGNLGIETDGGQKHMQMVDHAMAYGKYKRTKHSYSDVNIFEEQIAGLIFSRDGKENYPAEFIQYFKDTKAETDEQIADIQYLLDYFGDDLPDGYRQAYEQQIAQLQWDSAEYDYYLLREDENYDKYVEAGKKQDEQDATLAYLLYGGSMTKEEKDRFYYLYGRDGKDSAMEYYNHLQDNQNGTLQKRTTENIEAATRSMVEENWLLANATGIITAPASAILNMAGIAYKAATGEDIGDTAFGWLNTYANTVNAETAQMIQDHFGEGTAGAKVIGAVYEILWNRGRSLMNAVAFPGLGAINEFVGSIPMAATAMFDEMAKLEEAGAEEWQIWALGTTALLCEAGTEMIELGHIKGAKELGLDTLSGIKEFLKQYPINGLSEALGESLNDIIEGASDRIVLGDESERAQRIWYYRNECHMSAEDAEAMAIKDEIYGVLHTAIISYLSPGVDVVQFASGKAALYNHYRRETKALQQQGFNVSIRDIRNAEQASARYQQEIENGPAAEDTDSWHVENPNVNIEDVEDFTPVPKPTKAEVTAQEKEYATEMEILESAKGISDAASQTAAVAAALNFGNTDVTTDRANAAAVHVKDVFANGIETIQGILEGGLVTETNLNTLKAGLQYASLGGENSACYQLVQSEEFNSATPDRQATMLAEAVMSDAQNQDVQATVAQNVHENRVAEQMAILMGNGAMEGTVKAGEAYDSAAAEARQARADLEVKQGESEAAAQALDAAVAQNNENPTDEGTKQVIAASTELRQRDESAQQYEQHKAKLDAAVQKAEAACDETKQKELTGVRQQAEANVAQIDQQRAERDAQIAEQQQIAAEQAAQAQAEEDERTGKAAEDKTSVMAEDWANQMHLEGEEREVFVQRVMNRQEQMSLGKIDMSGKVSNAEGFLAIGAFARKTGMPVELSDKLPQGVRGAYKDGIVYLNSNMIRSGNMTIGQALVEAALHEYTHGMQKTGSYRKYQDTVLNILYGKGNERNNQQLDLDIQEKIDTYKGLDNLDREGAIQEIVADFARLNMADKEMVNRFMDAGLGGRMRNSLHNVNQALKNFFGNMTGEDRAKAEDFRKAERLYQKALNELAKEALHPSGSQFSVSQFAQAAGLTFDEASQTLYNKNGEEIDGITEGRKITPDMVQSMPVGRLISAGLKQETISADKAAKIQEQFAGLLNMCARYRTTDMIWEIAASTLDSQFSAIKSNSDKQYSTTVDFGTICAKTQAIVDQLSRNMLTLGRGLKINEILDVYNDVYNAGLSVPCPVCYVFSRWMGVPSLLNAMKDYQDRFLGNQGEDVSIEETQRRVDEYIKEAQEQYGIDETYGERVAKARNAIQDKMTKLNAGMATLEENYAKKAAVLDARRAAGKTTVTAQKQFISAENKLNEAKKKLSDLQTEYDNAEVEAYGKAINKIKTKLDNDMNSVLDKIDGGETGNGLTKQIETAKREGKDTTEMEEQLAALRAKADEINAERAKVDGYNWVTQALCYLDENGRYVVDQENFQRTPDEILFDLNRTAEFSKYAKNWKYRSTRGAGMGKAILPYSGASLGDSVYGKNARISQNALLAQDYDQAAVEKGLESARQKAKQQNLIGGQRFQSTSDYRAEWGLDYIMTFIEQQAIGSCGQLYTKVAEAVPLFAKAGIDTNLSVMPYGDGYHIDENGKVVLDFSDVTGMDVKTAIDLKNQYSNVQLILVGINDTHILAALKDADIDFVIPWHSSGNSRDQLSSMMASVKEQLNESSDYTKLQSDAKYAGETALVDSAKAKLESGEELTTAETNALRRENNRNVRTKIITGKFINTKPTSSEMKTISESEFLQSLYDRFCVDESSDCYHVALTSSQASQIFPYEYWQTDVTKEGGTKDTADENGRRFCKYCSELGYVPRFSGREVEVKNEDGTKSKVTYGNFSGMQVDADGNMTFNPVEGYWKLLIDRSMYDLDGNYRSQQKIDVTNISMGEISDEINPETGKHSLENSDLNREDVAKMQKNRPKYRLDNPDIVNAHKQASRSFDDRMKLQHPAYNNSYQFSAYGDLTDADIDQMLTQANEDYSNAVERGDMEAAQDVVDFAAQQAGYTLDTFHGTGEYFTVFNRGEEGIHLGNREQAEQLADTRYSTRSERTDYVWNDIRDSVSDMTPEQRESLVRYAETILNGDISDRNGLSDFDGDINDSEAVVSWVDSIINRYEDETWETDTKVRIPTFDRKVGRNLMHLYAKINNPFMINGDIRVWSPINIADLVMARSEGQTEQDIYSNKVDITGSDIALNDEQKNTLQQIKDGDIRGDAAWDALSDVLDKNGFDGIKYLNTFEGDKNSYSYIALKQSDVKSADPITYDDNGNVIPLNERFNVGNPDIRYSTGGEMTDADIDQRLAEAGVIPAPEPEMQYVNKVPEESTYRELEGQNPMLATAAPGPQRAFGSADGMLAQSDEIDRRAKAYVMNQNGYTADSNPEQIDRAIQWIHSNKKFRNSDGFVESMEKVTSNDFDYRSADGQARMVAVMGMAVARGDTMAQVQLADAFNRQGTDLGRALQARKLFRLMTPQGRINSLQKLLHNTIDETGIEELNFSQWIYEAAAAANTEGDFEKVYTAAAQELAEQIPANWKDKLVGWRMLSMLGNPRTHVRNVIGNAMFIPMVAMKNKIGALTEIATRVKPGERTKTLGLASKDARQFSKQIVNHVEADLRGEAKYNDKNAVKQAQKIWGTKKGIISRTLGKALQAVSDFNSNALEFEDWVFLKGHFKRAMSGYMTANKLTSDDMKGDTLKKALEYSIQEAHKATYRDANSVATALNNFAKRTKGTNLEKGAAAVQFVVNAVLPFKKTPANILKRGIEYSPIGLVSAATDIKNMIQTVRHENNPDLKAPKRTVTPAQLIDKFASGLTGTGVMILGAALGALGAANAGFDDDDPEDRLKKLEGEQEYGVNFGKALNAVTSSLFDVELFGEKCTKTMDWAAPFSMPFFVGVALQKQLSKENPDMTAGDVLNSILGITEPVFNLSMLDGVNSLFNVTQNDPMNPATQIGMKILLNYGSSYVPTLLGQVARVADPTRRQTFVQSGSKPYQVFSTIESVQNKIPGLSQLNIPYRNPYGEAEQNGSALEIFFAPWYNKEIKGDEITQEIKEVFANTTEEHPGIIPEVPSRYFKVGQDTVRLTDKEYEQLQVVTGETGVNLLNELMQTDEYKISSPDTKAKMMESVWSYAEKKGKKSIDNDVKLDSWMTKGELKGNMVKAVIDKTIDENKKKYVENRTADLTKCLEQGDREGVDAIIYEMKEKMHVDDKTIRDEVSEYFRPLYYEADDAGRLDIKDLLNSFDIGYTKSTFSNWDSQAKKQNAVEEEEEDEFDDSIWLGR